MNATLASACTLICLSLSVCLGETPAPIQIAPRRILTNGTVYFRDGSIAPPSLAVPQITLDSPAPALNFVGLVQPVGGATVPDTMGAVSTNSIMTMLNSGVSVQARDGSTLAANSLAGFWTSTNVTLPTPPFDPRLVWDPYNDRWVASAAVASISTNSGILIGVSRTSSPTNFGDSGWNLRSIRADTNSAGKFWADQPTVGFSRDWIVVQANMFPVTNGAGTSRSYFWVFNKTNLYAGNLGSYTVLVHTNPATDITTPLSEVPAVTYDNSISTLWILQNANGNTNCVGGTNNSGFLRLLSITGPIGSETLNVHTNCYIVATNDPWADSIGASWYGCGFSPEKSGTKLGTQVDARLNNVVYRDGVVWCAHTIFLPATNPTRSAVQWWQIKPDTQRILQRGRIDDTSNVNFYSFGSLSVNRFGDVLVGYSSFSTNQWPSANYSFRAFYDPANELRNPAIFQPGLTNFGAQDSCRWGDYSQTCVDPINDADLWTIQEFAWTNTFDSNIEQDYWGTSWAQVKVTVPTNDLFSAPIIVTSAQGTTNGTLIRAARESGEPNHAGNTNTPSVWYRWTAPTNGNVAMNVTNNGSIGIIDTVLAVFTGTEITTLSDVISDHGGPSGSQVVFNATSNTVYYVAVAGWDGTYGDFGLSWIQPRLPYFTLQPRGWDVYMGTNVTFTAEAIGSPDPGYQWRANGVNIVGATNSSYTRSNVQTNDTGNYAVVATNSSGSTTSQVAHLQVYSTQKAFVSEASYNQTANYSRFLVSGITGGTYVVEASTNLINWSPINTNITTFTNLDFDATNFPYRFYRALYRP